MELILDASSEDVTTAFARDDEIVWVGQWLSRNDHTRRLVPQILAGLSETSCTFRDITSIIVALGPGPFNALRVALAAAKGLSIGTGTPLCGVSTLEAEAARCPTSISEVRVVLRAGKSGFATATFVRETGGWSMKEPERIVDQPTLLELAAQGPPLCGESDAELMPQRAGTPGGGTHTCAPVISRIDALARLGRDRIDEGGLPPIAALQPLYARPPHITKPKERNA